jgi:hypothetical protein
MNLNLNSSAPSGVMVLELGLVLVWEHTTSRGRIVLRGCSELLEFLHATHIIGSGSKPSLVFLLLRTALGLESPSDDDGSGNQQSIR